MKSLTSLGLAFAFLLLAAPARGDYLGKNAAQWQIEFANATSPLIKRNAAFALGKLKFEAAGAVPLLTACAQSSHEDPAVRETVVYSLGQIIPRAGADASVTRILCKLAVDNVDERIKRSAAVALGSCAKDTAEVRSALEKALADSNPGVRQNAAWALGEICRKTKDLPLGSVAKGLKDSDKLVKRDTALALGKIIAHHSTFDDDGERAERQRVEKVREKGRMTLPDLLACVNDNDRELKKAACATLIHLVQPDDKNAIPILAAACKDKDIEVRSNAALALAGIGGSGAEPAAKVLVEVLQSSDPAVRQLAVLAFRNLDTAAGPALPSLFNALSADRDAKVRSHAATALGGLASFADQVVPVLTSSVANAKEAPEVRIAAAVSLQNIGACEAAVREIPRLVRVLEDSRQPPRVRERVLWALRVHKGGLADHEELFKALADILNEPRLGDPNIGGKLLRYDAAFLLGVFKGREVPDNVFPALLDFLKDSGVSIFTGLNIKQAGTGEGKAPQAGVGEQGTSDARINVIQALDRIGVDRVRQRQPEFIGLLRDLRANQTIDPNLREAADKLLESWRIK